MPKHNAKFAVKPKRAGDVHRSAKGYKLNDILCQKYGRKAMQDYTVLFEGKVLQLREDQPAIVRPKDCITIFRHLDGTLSACRGKTKLEFYKIGVSKKKKLNPVDWVEHERRQHCESRLKPAGGAIVESKSWLQPTPKSGTIHVGENRI